MSASGIETTSNAGDGLTGDVAATGFSRGSAVSFVGRALKSPRLVLSGGVLLIFVMLAIFAPIVAPYSTDFMDSTAPLAGPSADHWLGTDQLGRDVVTRLIYGARLSLQISVYSVAFAFITGVGVGLVSSYFGTWVDMILMRTVDVLLSFPAFVLAVAGAAFIGPSLRNISIIIGIVYMPVFARLAYVVTLALRNVEYVEAARSIGSSHLRIIFKAILPNSLAPLIVQTALSLGTVILTESGLSFLGVGVPPPAPSWGAQISEARLVLSHAPLLVVWPSIVIALAILSFNILGDALRDLLDPRTRS